MRLRYQGTEPRDGWQPGEVCDVSDVAAPALVATGLWLVVLVAPRLPGPPLDRMVHGPEVKPWP